MARALVLSAVALLVFLLGAPLQEAGAEVEGRWVWGRGGRGGVDDLQKRKYVAGGIDDGLLQEGGVGVLGGNGVKFGLGPGHGGGGGYQPPPFNGRPHVQPPPVHEGPVLAGPGGPIGVPGYGPGPRPGFGGPGFGGPGIGGGPGPGIKGPGFGGPGIGGPGIGGPGIGGPGIGGPGIGGGPGFGGPGGFGGHGGHGGHGGRPGILTGPVPSWEQERLDALGIGHRYHSFDTCSCVHSFNCKEPALKFGKCDKDKQYCCNGIRPATEGHGVRKPHFGGPPPPPGPLPHPGGPGPYPGGPGPYPGGPGPYPGGQGPYPGGQGPYPGGPFEGPYPGSEFARSAKVADKKL